MVRHRLIPGPPEQDSHRRHQLLESINVQERHNRLYSVSRVETEFRHVPPKCPPVASISAFPAIVVEQAEQPSVRPRIWDIDPPLARSTSVFVHGV